MSEDGGAKPETRSRRITVMGRRKSRATGENFEEGDERAAADAQASTSDLEGESAFGTQELDPPASDDDGEKTNPRARADEIAAALTRLTPEPDEPRTNPRIVMSAFAGSGGGPAVVIAQAQIIGAPEPASDDSDDSDDRADESGAAAAPARGARPGAQSGELSGPAALANALRASIPVPSASRRISISEVPGPAVAAFEAEQAALRAAESAQQPVEQVAAATAAAAEALPEPVAAPISETPLSLEDAFDDLEDAEPEEAEPEEAEVAGLTLEPEPGDEGAGAAQRRANTPPPPPERVTGPHAAQPSGPTPRKPPPPPTSPKAIEDEKKRKRVRQWWERFFSDEYLLTVPPPTSAQVGKQVDFIEASLGLAKGAMILDVGCGLGLHSIELARRGHLVVGLDLSLAMITRAAETAQEQGVKLNFLHADIREIAFDGAFDAVISMGTTFGFFDDDANRDVLSRLYQALRPGGRILLDVANRDYVVRWQPNLVWFEGEGCVCMEESDFNYFNSRLVVKRTVMREDGQQSSTEYSLRAYSLHELGQLTQALGFRVIEVSGQEATRGVFFGSCSTRILMLAERRAPMRGSVAMPPERNTGEVPRPTVTGEVPKPPPKPPTS